MIVTRFAPSPTGRMHLGNLRVAVLNALAALREEGEFWLRVDDTDAARSEERFVEAIRQDLAWLGLTPTGEVRQSQRLDLYERRFEELRAAGRVYPCFESAEELDLRRKVLRARGLPPVYERTALALSEAEVDAKLAAGERPHWRFKLDHTAPIVWHDAVRGEQRFDPAHLSDPVVRRADGSWLYLLPSVIDDIDMGITHVIRGEDHVSNTAAQAQMFDALGASRPTFGHVALLTGAEGKLSKRDGAADRDALGEAGIEPETVRAYLARLGTRDPLEPQTELMGLAAGFDLSRFGRAPAPVVAEELATLNARIVHQLPHERVAERLPPDMTPVAWEALRGNLTRIDEAPTLWASVVGPVAAPALSDEDRAVVAAAAAVLDGEAFADWKLLTAAVGAATGAKGRALFLPLRRALTGADAGPDMASLLPLIGRERAIERLRAALA